MTAKQRRVHVEKIKSLLVKNGWDIDRWDNFKKTIGDNLYRVKFQKTSLRFERKSGGGWFKITSDYFKNIRIEDDTLIIKKLIVRI